MENAGIAGAAAATGEPPDGGTMTLPTDMAQFGQWLTEYQGNLVQELYRQSRQDQVALLQRIEDGLAARTTAAGAAGTAPGVGAPQFRLARLDPDDGMEAYLTTFEWTATLACWPPAQWSYILGPYLSGPAQMV